MPDSMRFDSLSIRGFRGLQHVEFEKLGKVNLIVGKNDVGKTSVLEGAFLAAGFGVAGLPIAIQNQRTHQVRDSRDLLLLFRDLRTSEKIEFVADTPADTRRLAITPVSAKVILGWDTQRPNGGNNDDVARARTSYSSKPDTPHYALRWEATLSPRSSEKPLRRSVGTILVVDGQPQLMNDPDTEDLEAETITINMLLPGLGYDSDAIAEVLVRKEQDKLIRCLQTVNPRVQGITVSGDIAHVDIGLDRMVPISMCGAGLVRATQILSACIVGDVRMLLIDELGCGLHHSALEPLLTAILTICDEQDMQVVFTTHSLEVMQCVQRLMSDGLSRFQKDTECYVLARGKDNRVRSYRYDYEKFDHVIAHRIEIR